MFGALGHRVTGIHRVEVAGVRLGPLQSGDWRLVTEREMQQLVRKPKPMRLEIMKLSQENNQDEWPKWLK